MFCQNCGQKLAKGVKSCKKCGAEVVATQSPPPKKTENKLSDLHISTVKKLKAIEAGVLAKLDKKTQLQRFKQPSTKNKKPANEIEESSQLIQKNLAEQLKTRRVGMRIPLYIPDDLKQSLVSENAKRINFKHEKGKGLKVSYVNSDGAEKTLVSGARNYFNETYDFRKQGKPPFIGLGLVKSKKAYGLKMITPKTAPQLSQKLSRNQGEALLLQSTGAENGTNTQSVKKAKSMDAEQGQTQDNKLLDLLSDNSGSELNNFFGEKIDNIAWQDFSYYEYVETPELEDNTIGELVFSDGMLDVLAQFSNSEAFSSVFSLIRKIVVALDLYAKTGTFGNIGVERNVVSLAYQEALMPSGALSALYEIYYSLPADAYEYRDVLFNRETRKSLFGPRSRNADISGIYLLRRCIPDTGCIYLPTWKSGDPAPLETIQIWQEEIGRLYGIYQPIMTNPKEYLNLKIEILAKNTYPFNVYKPLTTNLGQRLVFRQQWRPLGIQKGETVRTIPLGPKQTEKVSTKIIRRQKVTRTSESLRATESTSETADTAKDSSEVITEAAESNKWNAEAEAGLDLGFFSIGGGGGSSGESSEKSKNTSTHLSETMQKTANKLRTETKVVVSSESESTYEVTTASEIMNPNDEIAITYVFSKIQRQYEIFTRLAEVQSVVYVAEELPAPSEITEEWVKEHDWIIAKVLMDDSFRDALNAMSQDESPTLLDSNAMGRYENAFDGAIGPAGFLKTIAGTATTLSLDSVNLSQEAQRTYRDVQKDELEKHRISSLLNKKKQRLLQHIRNNILHYCRAIWSQEDSEQRMLRYQKANLQIPAVWRFTPDDTTIVIDPSVDMYVEGTFSPDYSDPATVKSVVDVINPAGPIGYAGNYAIYYLKGDAQVSIKDEDKLFNLMHFIKSPYVDTAGQFVDPAMRALKEDSTIVIPDPIPVYVRKEMAGLVPEIRAKYSPLNETEKSDFLKDGLTPEQKVIYAGLPDEDKGEYLKENDVFLNTELYYEYLFRKEHTRLSLVDTNNLVIDLIPGKVSALENFKRLHRYYDVVKVVEEIETLELENKRRNALITDKKYGDPDIEKVTIVANENKELTEMIAGISASSAAVETEEP